MSCKLCKCPGHNRRTCPAKRIYTSDRELRDILDNELKKIHRTKLKKKKIALIYKIMELLHANHGFLDRYTGFALRVFERLDVLNTQGIDHHIINKWMITFIKFKNKFNLTDCAICHETLNTDWKSAINKTDYEKPLSCNLIHKSAIAYDISCGHTFCLQCITEYKTHTHDFKCPLCREKLIG